MDVGGRTKKKKDWEHAAYMFSAPGRLSDSDSLCRGKGRGPKKQKRSGGLDFKQMSDNPSRESPPIFVPVCIERCTVYNFTH